MSISGVQPNHSNPFSQIQQFCSSISLQLNKICKSTDSTFRRVHVIKRDEQGNIKLYNSKDRVTGETKIVSVLSYIEEIETGNMQLDEPAYIISVKCALLVLGIPLYTLGKIAWHAFKTPFDISIIAINTLERVGQHLMIERFYESAVEMRKGCSLVSEAFCDGLSEIIKDLLFGLGAEFASMYGIVRPYQGRWFEQLFEHAWQNGAHYKDDFRYVPPRAGESCWTACVKDMQDAHPCYLAHCFQVRGNVMNNPHITVVRREAL